MKNNLAGLTVGIVCAIVMIGTVLVPNINDIVDGNVTTYTNEGTYYYEVDPDDEKIIITSSSQSNWTLNGETYSVYGVSGVPIISTDVCRVVKTGYFVSVYDETGVRVANATTQTYLINMTYEPDSGTFTFTQYSDLTTDTVSVTLTYNVDHFILYNPNGDYVALISDGDSAPSGYYVNSLSDVICGGAYTTGDLDTSYFGQGETVTVGVSTYTASATATTENVLDDVLTVSDYTVTVTDGTTTETFIPYTIYVPATVEGHTTEQTTINTLYGIIPIFVIIGVLCAVTYAVMRNRD